jgi:type I site-specific restriction endonuclease
MAETPEQRARREIDANLMAAGWIVQNRDELDLTAGRGIAVTDFSMKSGFGFADYLLYLDRKAVGAIEARAEVPSLASKRSPPSMRPGCLTACRRTGVRCRSCSSPMGQ